MPRDARNSKQLACDMFDCTIYLLLSVVGLWSILDANYPTSRLFCMLTFVMSALVISAYELSNVCKLLGETGDRHNVIFALLSFFYATNLLSSALPGLVLLRGFFHDYHQLITS